MTPYVNILRAAGSRWLAGPGLLRRLEGLWWARLMLLIWMVGLVVAGTPSANAQDKAMDYQVKAAFLVNFPKYVDWPASGFAKPNSPITVAVFGDDNVANEFQNMIQDGLAINGHPVVLKRIRAEAEIDADCQILFIAGSEQSRTAAILEKLKGSAVLTVGETANFLEQGGMVNLVPKNRKIRLQVNLTAASQARLKISSRLLVAADYVKGKQS